MLVLLTSRINKRENWEIKFDRWQNFAFLLFTFSIIAILTDTLIASLVNFASMYLFIISSSSHYSLFLHYYTSTIYKTWCHGHEMLSFHSADDSMVKDNLISHTLLSIIPNVLLLMFLKILKIKIDLFLNMEFSEMLLIFSKIVIVKLD